MPTTRICLVSFTDTNGIRHAVEVAASTLYEAATLAMAHFRRCGFTENAPGPATRLTVTVKGPSTSHEVQWGRSKPGFRLESRPARLPGCVTLCGPQGNLPIQYKTVQELINLITAVTSSGSDGRTPETTW